MTKPRSASKQNPAKTATAPSTATNTAVDKKVSEAINPDQFPQRIVIRFRAGFKLPYSNNAEKGLQGADRVFWDRFSKSLNGLKLQPLFPGNGKKEIDVLLARAKRYAPGFQPPNLLGYFFVDLPSKSDPKVALKLLQEWSVVEASYLESPPLEPPVDASDDDFNAELLYLESAPTGIDARFAWTQSGGDGLGESFIDVEWGWDVDATTKEFTHEDLKDSGIRLVSGVNKNFFSHGTSVIGIIRGSDNNVGGLGVAPRSNGRLVSQWRQPTDVKSNLPAAILHASSILHPSLSEFGAVLLIEAQIRYNGIPRLPVEFEVAIRDVIQTAVAGGAIVIEAAGNGDQNLDTTKPPEWEPSGAILVAAGRLANGTWTRQRGSNHGEMVDCFAWGSRITTTKTSDYEHDFGMTSGASAIIAGAALCVQGMHKKTVGTRLLPNQMRSKLHLGTSASGIDQIGIMPDLKQVVSTFEA
jgi:subtilisin family serine protease